MNIQGFEPLERGIIDRTVRKLTDHGWDLSLLGTIQKKHLQMTGSDGVVQKIGGRVMPRLDHAMMVTIDVELPNINPLAVIHEMGHVYLYSLLIKETIDVLFIQCRQQHRITTSLQDHDKLRHNLMCHEYFASRMTVAALKLLVWYDNEAMAAVQQIASDALTRLLDGNGDDIERARDIGYCLAGQHELAQKPPNGFADDDRTLREFWEMIQKNIHETKQWMDEV